MSKKTKIYYGLAIAVLLMAPAASVVTSNAASGTAANIKSQGLIIYDNNTPDTSDDAIFDASDLVYLANKVDALKEIVK